MKCGRTFDPPSKEWKFLGTYTNYKFPPPHQNLLYDLYIYGSETFAVFGKDAGSAFMGDSDGAPLGYQGIFWSGPEVVDAPGADALLEAAARSKI